MCRFMIFKGKDSIVLEDLLTKPDHLIINQLFDLRLRLDMRNPINGDGFGVGYYTPREDAPGSSPPLVPAPPCVFKAITPAWNNQNLERLAASTSSSLVFAHVRALTYGVLSETNCHPFTYGNIMFMHNGGISGFLKIKKRLVQHIDDEWFLMLQGLTDLECLFAVFLDTLDKMGYDPRPNNPDSEYCRTTPPHLRKPPTHIPHTALRKALLATIQLLKDWQVAVTLEPLLLNFAVTDGELVVVLRYITLLTDEAALLHFLTGSSFRLLELRPNEFKVERLSRSQDVVMIALEPLTFQREDWITVPTNTTLTVHKQTVLLHPVEDEFYNPDIDRSSGLAVSKGMMGTMPVDESQLQALSRDTGVPPLAREGRLRELLRGGSVTAAV